MFDLYPGLRLIATAMGNVANFLTEGGCSRSSIAGNETGFTYDNLDHLARPTDASGGQSSAPTMPTAT
jgi:YD repeat-containing protein